MIWNSRLLMITNCVTPFIPPYPFPSYLPLFRLTGPDRFVSSPVPNFETGPKYDFAVQSGLDCDTVRS